jgi:hypothetical protein
MDVAVGPDGSVYVSDWLNNRISVFNPQGAFLRAFGYNVIAFGGAEICTNACQAGQPGGAAGQLNFARGLTVDAEGTVYVGDSENDRITVFDSAGNFLRAFGYDVVPGGSGGLEVCTTSCQSGVGGGSAGQLDSPQDAAVDSQGNLYVPEFWNTRVSVFTVAGGFLRAFGADVIPGGGTGFETCTSACKSGGPGLFGVLTSAATDCRGSVYLADQASLVRRYGEASMAPPPCGGNPPPADTTAPNTRLRGPKRVRKGKVATFRFSSTEPGSSFRCKLDTKPARRCRSPRRIKTRNLALGRHRMSVVAVDASGNADPTPAVVKFRILRRRQ